MDKSPFWKDLMAYVKEHNINAKYICDYCKRKFHNGDLPTYCILNNLFTHDVSDVITSLKTFKKFTQRVKAFQTVLKIGTVINKKLSQRQMIQKVEHFTYHFLYKKR